MTLYIRCIGDKAYYSLDNMYAIRMPHLNVLETKDDCFPSTIAFHDIDTVSVV